MEQYQAHDIIKQLYYSKESITGAQEILDKYASPEEGIGNPLEFPDRISNVNGNHLYKLISAKDINFNNVLLPNSIVPDTNWGSFDESRRWPSGYPINVNDVYELMNVVDYLLCATEDLWSELNKLKYGSNVIANLWFINDLNGQINQIYEINSAQFQRGSSYSVNLNPKTYFTTLPKTTMENFGIATHFFDDDHVTYPIIRRVIQSTTTSAVKKNGIIGYIDYEDTNNYFTQQNENVNGTITSIYGYKIGDELHFYPMFNIDNFFLSSKDMISNFSSLVDTTKMKLNYDLYFRRIKQVSANTNVSVFEKLHVDFLYADFATVGHPYILYYIDESNKRRIVYIHVEPGTNNKTVQQISNQLASYSEYINNFYDVTTGTGNLGEFGGELEVYGYDDEENQYPYLYHVSDNSRLTLFVQTPNTSNFSLSQNTLPIQYFKSLNQLNCVIKLDNGKIIDGLEDKEQAKGILYSPIRYNLPDNNNIIFEINGTFLDNNSQILYDDEYTDVLIPSNGAGNYVVEDETKYYYYDHLDSNGKRVFVNFGQSSLTINNFFSSDNQNAISINNIDNVKSAHVYMKNEDAYKLKYKFVTNSLLNQITDYSVVVNEVSNIENASTLTKNSDLYTLSFNYDLPVTVEQLKFDLRLSVDETSKVKSTELNIPISLNKIHQPCIQFVSRDIMQQEIKQYNNYIAYTFGDKPGAGQEGDISENYILTNKVGEKFSSKAYGNRKTNQNTIQGNDDDDKFNTFSELFTYVIENKYKNFEKNSIQGNVRTDILNSIDEYARHNTFTLNNTNVEATFNYDYTYDNTGRNMRKLIIAYHPENNMLNLIGGEAFKDYLKSMSPQLSEGQYQSIAYFDNVTYSPELNKDNYIYFDNIFSINGLGFNYRLHGGDSYLYINKEGLIDNGVTKHDKTDLPFNNQYNLISNSCHNTENNLCKFLEVSVTDNDNQIDDEQRIGSELTDNNTTLIENDIIDIHLASYMTRVQCDYYRLSTNYGTTDRLDNRINNLDSFTMTYYIPITYMVSKNTTFYPNQEVLPEHSLTKTQYDLTDDNDILKYKEYVQYWDSNDETDKYKPITLSLQLKENLSNNTPFFYESNVAKLKFDIRRIDPKTIDNTDNSKYTPSGRTISLAIGQRYYLADLINVVTPSVRLNSIGSYPKYNTVTEKFDIIDIYENISELDPIPILKYNGNYQYDIEKCSALNKINFTSAKFNNNNVGDTSIDLDLQWFEIDNTLLSTLTIGDIITGNINLDITNSELFGNKLYLNNELLSNPKIYVNIIQRTKPNNLADDKYITDKADNQVLTNRTEQFNFVNMVDETIQTQTFKHFEFYGLPDSPIELFQIPDMSRLNSMYLYDNQNKRMVCIGTIQKYFDSETGEVSNQQVYEELYKDLLIAFNAYTIYEKISD